MAFRDCVCRDCLCYRGTHDASSLCAGCQGGRHPGDPRPTGRFLRAAESVAASSDRLVAFAAAPDAIHDWRLERGRLVSRGGLE